MAQKLVLLSDVLKMQLSGGGGIFLHLAVQTDFEFEISGPLVISLPVVGLVSLQVAFVVGTGSVPPIGQAAGVDHIK